MGLLRKAASQNHLVFSAQFKAGQQGILSRTAHVQAGDDVKDFRHFSLNPLRSAKDVDVVQMG